MAIFFDDLIEPFYVRLDADYRNPDRFRQGQLFFAAFPYVQEQKQYWRPVGYDALTQTSASHFNAVGHAADLFNRRFPLYAPQLASNEEFVVVRAKRRPVVLLAPPSGNLAGSQSPLAHHHLVVPRYGAVKGLSGQPKYPSEFVDRVRTLEFPEILFSPAQQPDLTKDGFLRGDLLQPVPKSHLEPTQLALAPEALAVLLGQLRHRFFEAYDGEYASWREMLLHPEQ